MACAPGADHSESVQVVRDFRTNILRRIAICGSGLLLGSIALHASAQSPPPVGSWDVVLSSKYQHGVAQVAFADDGSISGIAAFTFFGRGVAHTNHGYVLTNLYGSARLDGEWVYDRSNHITGFINELSRSAGTGTNINTNAFSFRATVKPTRLSMLAFGPQGTVNYKGIPLVATNDLSGHYYATVRKRRIPFASVEIFDLASISENFYQVLGRGPAYDYDGLFLLSRQHYAGFYQQVLGSNTVGQISAYAGPFNIRTRRGSLIGTDGTNTTVKYRMLPEGP